MPCHAAASSSKIKHGMRWSLGLSFLAMAAWIMVSDKLDAGDAKLAKYGVFLTTLIAFFLAEMGDKMQIAVVAGTTFGMMRANVPAVLFGEHIARKVQLKLVHGIAAAIFALLGVGTLLGAGASFGL